jgi:hypothetical protein
VDGRGSGGSTVHKRENIEVSPRIPRGFPTDFNRWGLEESDSLSRKSPSHWWGNGDTVAMKRRDSLGRGKRVTTWYPWGFCGVGRGKDRMSLTTTLFASYYLVGGHPQQLPPKRDTPLKVGGSPPKTFEGAPVPTESPRKFLASM